MLRQNKENVLRKTSNLTKFLNNQQFKQRRKKVMLNFDTFSAFLMLACKKIQSQSFYLF
jgi:hypothetical protein